MTNEKKRKINLTQLDEIWQAAKSAWGDPGLRHPPPDSRFESLRGLLNEIEDLFEQDRPEDTIGDLAIGMSVSAKRRPLKQKPKRKLYSDDMSDEDEELPF